MDAHSHLGLDGYGMGWEGRDYNERCDVVSAHLRGIDSFNPLDRSIPMALAWSSDRTIGTLSKIFHWTTLYRSHGNRSVKRCWFVLLDFHEPIRMGISAYNGSILLMEEEPST